MIHHTSFSCRLLTFLLFSSLVPTTLMSFPALTTKRDTSLFVGPQALYQWTELTLPEHFIEGRTSARNQGVLVGAKGGFTTEQPYHIYSRFTLQYLLGALPGKGLGTRWMHTLDAEGRLGFSLQGTTPLSWRLTPYIGASLTSCRSTFAQKNLKFHSRFWKLPLGITGNVQLSDCWSFGWDFAWLSQIYADILYKTLPYQTHSLYTKGGYRLELPLEYCNETFHFKLGVSRFFLYDRVGKLKNTLIQELLPSKEKQLSLGLFLQGSIVF